MAEVYDCFFNLMFFGVPAMTSLKSLRLNVLILFGVLLVICTTSQADWPTYRHDNARSGSTSESLRAPLRLGWVYTSAHPPHPAWSGPAERAREGYLQRHRVIFDDAFQVAAGGNVVYFGSSSDHKIHALDAATGREKWSFYTGGPVRLSPTLAKDRLFVGSDDGFVYCLKAKDGQLIWKVRPGPNAEQLLGNGKMISRWPIRTNAMVEEGIVYFTGGIFPHENVYICAVKAEDGSVVWKNDSISEEDAYRNEFSPQGYLLTAGTQLFIPSGRALPVGFDRRHRRRDLRPACRQPDIHRHAEPSAGPGPEERQGGVRLVSGPAAGCCRRYGLYGDRS